MRRAGPLQGWDRNTGAVEAQPHPRIPLRQLDDRTTLAESNTVLDGLARATRSWAPCAFTRASALPWMPFNRSWREPPIAIARDGLTVRGTPLTKLESQGLPPQHALRAATLELMATHPVREEFFVADECGVADLALRGCTPAAHKGGLRLNDEPPVTPWWSRIASQPRSATIRERE